MPSSWGCFGNQRKCRAPKVTTLSFTNEGHLISNISIRLSLLLPMITFQPCCYPDGQILQPALHPALGFSAAWSQFCQDVTTHYLNLSALPQALVNYTPHAQSIHSRLLSQRLSIHCSPQGAYLIPITCSVSPALPYLFVCFFPSHKSVNQSDSSMTFPKQSSLISHEEITPLSELLGYFCIHLQ